MKKNKYMKLLKAAIMYFIAFMIGFIGTILIVEKQITEIANTMIDNQIQTTQYINYLSYNIVAFVGKVENENYLIDVIKSDWYNYLPFFNGFILVVLVFALTLLVRVIFYKKIKNSK